MESSLPSPEAVVRSNEGQALGFHPLQSAVLPTPSLETPACLYWRSLSQCKHDASDSSFTIAPRGYIDFESYYNSLSLRDWVHFCGIKDFGLRIAGTGETLVRLYHSTPDSTRLLTSQVLQLELGSPHVIPFLPHCQRAYSNGQLGYISASLYSGTGAQISELTYGTFAQRRRKVRLGGVITHFRRGELTIPAITRFSDKLAADHQFREAFNLAVIDNSRTLPESLNSDSVQIIPNGNFGGAGGFSRGLLHFAKKGDFTHVLFMDDDATLELESIKRTIAYLEHEQSPRAAVAGTLFINPHKTVVYEAGAHLKKGLHQACGRGIDVSNHDGLHQLQEADEAPSYGGWWFFAFPLASVTHYPFPYFVRGDDAAFGYLNSFDTRCPSGVACWGDSFTAKETPLNRYLDVRHALRHAAMFDRDTLDETIHTFCSWIKDLSDCYLYASAEATLIGIQDACKPANFWANNADLTEIRSRLAPLVAEEKFVAADMFDLSKLLNLKAGTDSGQALTAKFRGHVRGNVLRFLSRKITLNGHLLPSALAPHGSVVLPRSPKPRMVFPYKSAVYVDNCSQGVMHRRADLRRYLRLRLQIAKFKMAWILNKSVFTQHIESSFRELTSDKFWRKIYLDSCDS